MNPPTPTQNFPRALIIDDTQTDIFVCAKLILNHNIAKSFITFRNTSDALTYLKKCSPKNFPQLILLDLKIPEKEHALAFLSHFDKIPGKLRNGCHVVLTTAFSNSEQETINNLLNRQLISKCLQKPILNPMDLMRKSA
jgi:CheY-like chemotaxis protein